MRKLTVVAVLMLLAPTGCFLRTGVLPGFYARATSVVGSGGAITSGTTSNVTVNGQPATATVAVNANGSMGVAVAGPGASVSATTPALVP